jgi:hypothetical protein
LRETKAGFDQRVDHECCIDRYQELFKAGVLKRGDENRFAVARKVDSHANFDIVAIGSLQSISNPTCFA